MAHNCTVIVQGQCDTPGCDVEMEMGEFNGETKAKAKQQARWAGWILNNKGQAFCPDCAAKMK